MLFFCLCRFCDLLLEPSCFFSPSSAVSCLEYDVSCHARLKRLRLTSPKRSPMPLVVSRCSWASTASMSGLPSVRRRSACFSSRHRSAQMQGHRAVVASMPVPSKLLRRLLEVACINADRDGNQCKDVARLHTGVLQSVLLFAFRSRPGSRFSLSALASNLCCA